MLVDGEEEYEVETILDSRIRYRRVEYLVKYRGYGDEENTWVAHFNVHAPRVIERFHRDHPDKPRP